MNFRTFLVILSVFMTHMSVGQVTSVTISGIVKDNKTKAAIAYANVIIKYKIDSSFVTGTVTNEDGRFSIPGIKPGNYLLEISFTGFESIRTPVFIGSLSAYLDIPQIELSERTSLLEGVTVTAKAADLSSKLDKKTYSLSDNISQSGGSVLQTMQNLPGVTVQDGKVQLRGNDKVTVLIDGKQTALTGFGSQTGLDNIPASAIDRIEIINNPSASFDANGNAGIINIIMKKNRQQGFNGKIGIATGLGALWIRKENLPDIRPQYTATPKLNPSLTLNYKKNKVNSFIQVDNLYTQTLNKNEFVTRNYDDGTVIQSQLKRNRNTNFLTTKAGLDFNLNQHNFLSVSGLYGSEKIIDRGDQPFFSDKLSERLRLWQFLEDELKTTVMATAAYQHKFKEPGHFLNVDFNYTFHREDEQYFYDNHLPSSKGTDAFKLLSDEQVYDLTIDYSKPLKYGRIETGIKFRNRAIPTNMDFRPGVNSVLDTTAGGWATYKELIPAIYGNYVFETKKWEAELGLRMEYVNIQYEVNTDHSTYKSDGYNYTQPFPNFRVGYKLSDQHKLSFSFNRRVDRPNEVDIRIFPKYDDAEIIKVGNPALRPQFTNSIELGYKNSWNQGYFYAALYHRFSNGTITRISSMVPGSTLIYAMFQNAGKSTNSGLEAIFNHQLSDFYRINLNGTLYRNQINAFTVTNLYPATNIFSAEKQTVLSGNLKFNNNFKFRNGLEAQLTAVYLAPDIIPQGKIDARFSIDAGFKKMIQNKRGEIFINATDFLNTMVIRRSITGIGFRYTSDDYYETQVFRIGYSYKF